MAKDTRTPADRFRMALDLYEAAEAMLRQKLRRTHPDASAEEIAGFVREWLERRPGAEHGDAVGRPVEWPRQGSA
jgi:hypothetical protein